MSDPSRSGDAKLASPIQKDIERNVGRVNDHAAQRALSAFLTSAESGMADAMREAVAAAMPYRQSDPATLPEPRPGDPAKIIATLALLGGASPYAWRVMSDCGVVKLYSSRDGCMLAINPARARQLADEFRDAVHAAADSVDRATSGGER